MEKDYKIPGLIRYSRSQCGRCGAAVQVEQYHGLDLSLTPEGKQALLEGKFFQWRCPQCGLEGETGYPCRYFDPDKKLGIVLVPDLDSTGAEQALQAMNRGLEGLSLPGMTHRAAGNFYAMQEVVRAFDAGLDDRVLQLIKPIIIGQLQAQGETVWNGFFQGVSTPDPKEEPIPAVLYASLDKDSPAEYGQPIYWFDIFLTNRTIVHTGVNETLFQMCRSILDSSGLPGDDGRFHLYDLNWGIGFPERTGRD